MKNKQFIYKNMSKELGENKNNTGKNNTIAQLTGVLAKQNDEYNTAVKEVIANKNIKEGTTEVEVGRPKSAPRVTSSNKNANIER